jgi:ribosome-associated protein
LAGKTSIGDYMIVASGRSQRHVGAIADRLIEKLKEHGIQGVRAEGMPLCDWVLVDAGDIIVHIFRPEVRAFYNIEKMWGAGKALMEAAE